MNATKTDGRTVSECHSDRQTGGKTDSKRHSQSHRRTDRWTDGQSVDAYRLTDGRTDGAAADRQTEVKVLARRLSSTPELF